MMEEAAKAGLPEPALEEYAGGIQVTFLKSMIECFEGLTGLQLPE